MPISDPLRSLIYESGGLIQACSKCAWAQRGHKAELTDCPDCGQSLDAPLAIRFGGLTVIYDGTNFQLHSSNGGFVVMERADMPEIVQFLCRHTQDLRTGSLIHDDGRARRIQNHPQFMNTAGVMPGKGLV